MVLHRRPLALRAYGAGVADDGVEGHVPVRDGQLLDVLTVVGKADQAWVRAAQASKGEGAVVEAAAHTQSIALGIETDQRHEYQIQRPGGQAPCAMRAMARARLRDGKAIGAHGRLRVVMHEP